MLLQPFHSAHSIHISQINMHGCVQLAVEIVEFWCFSGHFLLLGWFSVFFACPDSACLP